MEGKSGINFILTIVAILFLVAGVAFCVLFGINMTIPGRTYDVAVNLYIGLAGIGLGVLMLIGTNIATNTRIAADNTYDTMRHIELLCKKEGISMVDLARKDAKTAKKEAELLEKEQAKAFEAQAQAMAQAQAQAMAQAQAKAMADMQAQQAQAIAQAQAQAAAQAQAQAAAQAQAQPAAQSQATAVADVDVEPQPVTAEAPQEAAKEQEKPVNCGIEYAEWKSKVEPIGIKCGNCGGEMSVRKTKIGIVVLACKNVAEGSCKSTPLPVESMAQQFVEWYNAAFGGALTAFDMDTFVGAVGAITVTDGTVRFTGK